MKNIFISLAAICAFAGSLLAGSISLTWNPAPYPVNGYEIAYGQVGKPATNLWPVGPVTTTTITDLVSSPGLAYRFIVAAIDTNNVKSVTTSEVVSAIYPQSIKNVRLVGRSGTSFTLTWELSNEADVASYRVRYGVVGSLNNSVYNTGLTNMATLSSGLVSGSQYWMGVVAVNTAGVESLVKNEVWETLLPVGPDGVKVSIKVE